MKTRPDSHLAVSVAAAVGAVALCACGVYTKTPAPAISGRARAFVHARANRAAPTASAAEGATEHTVDVMGAVAQPGQFAIGPSIETVKQALDAAGGLSASAAALRLRPGDDV